MRFIESKSLPNTFIALNELIIDKFVDPYIYGERQQRIIKNFAVEVLKFLSRRIKAHTSGDKFIVRILTGAKYYYYPEAWAEVFNENVLTGDIRILSRIRYDERDITAVVLRDLTTLPT
ncbi:hypothetical protein DRN86_00710, partial [Candidatus Geothermarchaeota archaeon]